MTEPFKRGQKVQLVSGGPVMACTCVCAKQDQPPGKWWHILPPMPPMPWGAHCVWMDTKGHMQHGWFDPDFLRSVE